MRQLIYQSIAKTHGSEAAPLPNEDAFRVAEGFLALADGAGGTGLLCGEWAAYLVHHLPATPLCTFATFMEWLEPLAEAFVSQYEPIIQHDSYQLKRFYTEGSACTLAALWFTPHAVCWLTYGDSLVVRKFNESYEGHPFQYPHELSGSTHLLNWSKMPQAEVLQLGEWPAEVAAQYYLATDAIGKHLLKLLSEGQNLDALKAALISEEAFKNYISQYPDIEEDDYTLIFTTA